MSCNGFEFLLKSLILDDNFKNSQIHTYSYNHYCHCKAKNRGF